MRVALLAYELVPAVLLLTVPFSVHAGLFSKITGLFAAEAVAQTETVTADYSALNTPLLNALKTPDPLKAIGGGEVSYEDGALLSSGPVGEDQRSLSRNKNDVSVYTVREGDDLSHIAEMYDVTVNTIVWANDLKSAKDIHQGDVLVILPFVGVRHTVAKGETLQSIVKKYGGDLDEVLQYNELASADGIAVGDEIMIPGGEISAPAAAKKSTSGGSSAKSVKSGSSWLINPAPGSVETQGLHGNNGVDLASRGGAYIPVIAAAGGKVIVSKSSGWNGGYGQYIVIQHSNGEQTLYGHLSKNIAGVGDWVEQGEQIGVMGSTGRSTGTHLHFEVHGGTNPF
jgi:LysM repeat protein